MNDKIIFILSFCIGFALGYFVIFRTYSKFNKNKEIERIKILLCDMSNSNCDKEDIEKVIKYSMIVIDADKYDLDWKKIKNFYNIDELYRKYH